ncbi:MAG TPA: hypothetical protein VKU01_33915 [Bryobacteraceae bacterium]|nr:hypothetical protein [Bryobacteraceae bacterium]
MASVALGINDKGDIVGISFDANFNPRASLRSADGTFLDINSLVPADSALFLFDACSINSRGEIIGIAVDMDGNFHGYLASPSDAISSPLADSASGVSLARFDSARQVLQRRLSSGRIHRSGILR